MEHKCYEQRISGLYEGLEKSLRELKDMVTALRQCTDCCTNPFALFRQRRSRLLKHKQSEDSPKKAHWNLPKHAQSEGLPKQAQWNGRKHIQSEDSPKKVHSNLPKHSQTEGSPRPAQWSWLKRDQMEEPKRIQESVQQPGEDWYVPARSRKRGKRSGQPVRRQQAASRYWELLEAMTASHQLRRGRDVRRTTLMCPTRESWA